MNAEYVTVALTIIAIASLAVLSGLFGLLSLAGRILTHEDDRSKLGTALGHVYGAAGVLLLTFSGTLGLRLVVDPDGLLGLEPRWLNFALRTTLMVSALWCMISAMIAFPKLIARFRKRPADTYELNQAAVFGTLAQAMPIIVSNHEGTIQHTTAEFDALVGAVPGNLIGKQLETIMPERYIAGHAHGMQRYIETREPHIMGTVVVIDMLRRDGVEIPVYLALNTVDVGGKPWFVASIWPKPEVELEALVSTFSDSVAQTIGQTAINVEEVKADVKTLRKHADAADVRADAADVRADAAEARADARDKD